MKSLEQQRNWASWWFAASRISLDILVGTAVILVLSYVLWLWLPGLFALEIFWGNEISDFGEYVNAMKTVGSIGFFLALLGLGQNDTIKNVYYTYFFFNYSVAFDEEEFRRKDPKRRGLRAFIGMLGGGVLALIIAIILLPAASTINLLPENWTLNAQVPKLPKLPKIRMRQTLTAELPITSNIDQNLFQVYLEKDNEYILILEPIEKTSGIFTLVFPYSEVRRKEISLLDEGTLRNGGIDWRLLSVSKNTNVEFEIDFTGSRKPANYRLTLLNYDRANFDSIILSPTDSGKRIFNIRFQGQAGERYAILAFTNEGELIILVREKTGKRLLSTSGFGIEMVVFQPKETAEYEIFVRDRRYHQVSGFELRIVQLRN